MKSLAPWPFQKSAMAELNALAMAMTRITPLKRHHQTGPGRKTLDTYHNRISGRRYAPNGAREVARRRRQIAEGRLKAENGVVA